MKSCLHLLTCLAVALPFATAAAVDRPTVSFYVAPDGSDAADGSSAHPVRTLDRAVTLTRAVLSDARREIVVGDGFYEVTNAVLLTADDVDLTFRAAHPRRAVLSGAVRLTGWRTDPEDARFLVADLPFAPEDGMSYMLTCGGRDCPIAAWPEKGRMKYASVTDQWNISYETNAFPAGADLKAMDLTSVWLELPQEWATTRTLIATNDVASRAFALKSKASYSFKQFNHGFRLFNARFGLCQRGSWMYEASRRRVVYWPREGESSATIDCRLTRAGSIFAGDHARSVRIAGFVLEGCAKSFVRKNPYDWRSTLGAIVLMGSADVTVDDCEIRYCASGGLFAMKPVRCEVRNCHVHDVGGTGVNFFDGGRGGGLFDCDIHDYGKTSVSSSGAHLQTSHIRCVGNHVHHGPGNGVVMWSCDSLFASNELDHVMQKQRDGGGLYGGFVRCLIRDNYVHDIGGWPGLYCDEGSGHVLLTGNRSENCWWPTHMHCTTDIVVSNNVFRHKGGMRWSFQGGHKSRFVDNTIYTTANITSDSYVANCAEWARNAIHVLQKDGSYTNMGLRTLHAQPAKFPDPIVVPRVREQDGKPTPPKMDGSFSGDYPIRWQKVRGFRVYADGMPAAGAQPSCNIRQCYDDDYLYLHIHQIYPRLGPYPGCLNLNHVWGQGDGARVYLGEKFEFTIFCDGTVTSNDPTWTPGKEDTCIDKGGWYQGRGMEIRVPLAKFGGGRGKKVSFNAVNYNADADEYRWIFPTKGDNVRTGWLDFPSEDVKEVK